LQDVALNDVMLTFLGSYAIYYRSQNGLYMGNKIQSNHQLFYTTLRIFICLLLALMASVEADAIVCHRSRSARKLNFFFL